MDPFLSNTYASIVVAQTWVGRNTFVSTKIASQNASFDRGGYDLALHGKARVDGVVLKSAESGVSLSTELFFVCSLNVEHELGIKQLELTGYRQSELKIGAELTFPGTLQTQGSSPHVEASGSHTLVLQLLNG